MLDPDSQHNAALAVPWEHWPPPWRPRSNSLQQRACWTCGQTAPRHRQGCCGRPCAGPGPDSGVRWWCRGWCSPPPRTLTAPGDTEQQDLSSSTCKWLRITITDSFDTCYCFDSVLITCEFLQHSLLAPLLTEIDFIDFPVTAVSSNHSKLNQGIGVMHSLHNAA